MIKLGSNSIGKIYLGSSSIGKAYLGSNLVFQKGSSPTPPQPILPAGYAELLYVTTNGLAHIDTGVAGASDLEIKVKFLINTYVQYASIYGNYIDETYNYNRAILGTSNTALIIGGGLNRGNSVSGFSLKHVHTLTVNSTTAILDGNSTTLPQQSYTANSKNITLGASGSSTPWENNIGLRIYSFEIKKNGTTVLNLVPAIRDYDGAVGFYDLVSESFVKSLTGTEFIAGPVVGIIPYIRGGGNGSYIDTGITPDNTTKIIVWARNFNPGNDTNWLFGVSPASNDVFFDVVAGRYTRTGTIGAFYGTTNTGAQWSEYAWPYFSHYHKYELSADGLYVDDAQVVAGSSDSFSMSENIHLFGYNAGGTNSGSLLPIDICACKIYKNGVLVRDYTPVNSSTVVGLYDAVSGTVFTNAGSGSFTYGTFNTNAYTPLEYIATSGSSYFLAPAIGSYSLPIVTKFRPTATNASWFSPIGGRDNGNYDNRCEIFTGNTTYSNARLYSVLGSGDSTTMYTSTTAGAVRNKDIIVVKSNNTFTAYYNNAAFGSAATFNVGASYSTGVPLAIGATWQVNISACTSYFVGNIYYVGLGAYNLVPAKVGGVAGMYDTYNKIFYQSTTSTPFTAGPEI